MSGQKKCRNATNIYVYMYSTAEKNPAAVPLILYFAAND